MQWPDHDVPREPGGATYTSGLLQLVEQVQKQCPAGKPVIVHCSAGVGRTGTFLTVHHAQEMLVAKGEADPLAIVLSLRQQRPAMVQHLSQFFFVHDCVTDWAEDTGKSYMVQEAQTLDAAEEEQDGDESLYSADTNYSAVRSAEKKLASERRAKREIMLKNGTARKHKPADSHASGELHVAPIVYHGHVFEFNDVNGDGQLDWSEAQADGWTHDFFKEVSGGSAVVTVAKFTEFRAAAKAAELTARAAKDGGRPGMTPHPEMENLWYAGELTMPTAVDWVKGSERGSFLIRRSVSDPRKFHCLVSIVNDAGQKRVGRYELELRDNVYHLATKSYSSLKQFVKDASKTFILKDPAGGVKLTTPIVRAAAERRESARP